MPYVKVHPFGYIPTKGKRKKVQCRKEQCTRVQTIVIKKDIDVPIYDKQNNCLKTVVSTKHIQRKVIYHTDHQIKGVTLAETYWNAVLNSNGNYELYMKKYSKKNS